MEQEQAVLERIQRAEKEFNELLKREDLTFAIREELINGQRRSLGIVFVPNQPVVQAPGPIVIPDQTSFGRKVRRMLSRNN
jgi:hypothetical protein